MSESGSVNNSHLICTSCKTGLRPGAKFCGSCGAAGVRDTEAALAYMKAAWGQLMRGKRWVDKEATGNPVGAGVASIVALMLLFSLCLPVVYVPYIGILLVVVPMLLMVPFAYALIPATIEFIEQENTKREERRQQWLVRRQQEEEELRRQEEESRQEMLAYQRWFESLSPERQQVELMKQQLLRQEQQMQELMNQNQKIARNKQVQDVVSTWAIINSINNSNKHHR